MPAPVNPLFRAFLAASFCLLSAWASATAPKAPTIKSAGLSQADFSTSLVNGSRGILVQWTDNSSDEDFFVVYSRKGTSGPFGRTSQVSANSVNAAVIPITPSFPVNTVFQFAVAACKGSFTADRQLKFEATNGWAVVSEQSAMSSPITVIWPSGASSFTAPTGLNATASDDGTINFTFTDNSNSEEAHELNIRLASQTAESDWKTLKTFFGLSSDYYWPFDLRDHKLRIALTPGVAYQFRIRALRTASGGTSTEATDWSNTANFVMPTLTAPIELVAETPFENTISFTWTDRSNNEQGYFLERKLPAEDDTHWAIYETLPANSNVITVSPFEDPGVAYNWRVSAAFDTGTSTSSTTSLTSCVLNAAASSSGSKGVTCASTASLTTGAFVTGPSISVTGNTTSGSASVTSTNTSTLAVGMFLQGTGIPSGARILSIDSGTALTMTANATANGTGLTIAAAHFAANTTVTSITSATTFVISAAAYVNTSSAPITVTATKYTEVYVRGISNVVTAITTFNAPTGLQAPVDNTSTDPVTSVKLSWTDNSNGEAGFQVRYRLSSAAEVDASYTQAALINPGTSTAPQTINVTLTDQFPVGQSLVVQVRAFVDSSTLRIFSAASNQAVVTTKNSFSGELYAPITKGTAFTYSVQTTSNTGIADNGGTPSISVSNLPAGLAFTPTVTASGMTEAGIISGTPTVGGLFLCPMKATFTDGLAATANLQLRVLYPPAAPIKPKTITSRTLGLNTPVFLPLTDLFADPDTEKAVKFKIQIGASTSPVKEVNVVLFPTLTPQTVSNFMNYVLANDYENVVFNRSVAGFVVQAGSYKFIPSLSTTTPLFTKVLSRTSPLNEPGISNVLGTLAMAKLPTDPNSATHDFFFSLADNSANLDHQNSGFTAFGRVAGSGMTAISEIGALNTTPAAPATSADVDNRYSITVRDPRGGANSAQTVETFPVNKATVPIPGTIQSDEMVVVKSITPITDLLTYSTPTNSDATKVRASVVDGALKLEGLAVGFSNVSIAATDLDNNTTTQSFTVSVDDTYLHPHITKHPLDQTVNELGAATLSVTATGTNLTFQWRKNGVALTDTTTVDGTVISGTTTASLNLSNVHTSDAGSYTVVLTNEATTLISNVGHLDVLKAPAITSSPTGGAVDYLGKTTLTVVATGSAPLKYEWYLDDVLMPAAVTSSITINSMKSSLAGDWRVVVSNAAGSANSTIATVTINIPDTDGDGVNDEEEDTKGYNKNKADTDGDGYSDGVEKSLGTNPKLASSTPASRYFVAERDSDAVMGSVLMKRIPASSALSTTDYWLGATELTNMQFAAILQYGMKKLSNIEIIAQGTRRAVRYPKTTGNIICYLTDTAAILPTDAPATDLTTTNSDGSFIVPVALTNAPVRAVSWEAAYLAAAVMNTFHGYTSKSTASFTFAPSTVDGYRIPNDNEWEAAGLGGRTGTASTYPTGSAITSAQAWFAQTSATARPKNVGSYAANPFGCSDLAGNVAEWVFDPSGTESYVRGGGYLDPMAALSNASRALTQRSTLSKNIGIRLALDAPASPTITAQPAAFVLLRTDEALELTSAATGGPPLAFQWLRNSVAVSTQTKAKFSIASPTISNAGSYQVRVTTNGVNPQTSTSSKVNIVQLPTSRSFTIASSKDVTLTVPFGVAPNEKLTFVWFKGSTLMTNRGSIITGTDANSLVLKNCQPLDTANYTCEVRDSHGSPAVTIGFTLIVLGQPVVDKPVFTETTMVGETFQYQVTSTSTDVTHSPTKYTATGLPSGLTINATNGLISGKPLTSGTFNVVVVATNAVGTFSTQTVTLTVKSMADMQQSNAVGSFFGLIDRRGSSIPGETGLNDNLGGRIDFTVTKSATLSGKITLGTASPYSFSGSLDTVYNPTTPVNPTATILIKRTGKSSLGLSLTIPVSQTQTFTATLFELDSSGNATNNFVNIVGWRNQWNSTTIPAADYSGKHNIALRVPTGTIGDNSMPQGSGYAAITVNTAGSSTLAGKLPDGVAISFSTFLGPNGEQPIFQVLYGGKGSVSGYMKEAPGGFHLFTGTNALTWLKKPQAASTTDRLYRTEGISSALTPIGGLYAPPNAFNILMGLPAPSPLNARLTFEYGGLVPSTGFVQDFAISSPAVVSFTGATVTNSTTFKVTASTGSFTGTFKLIDGLVTRTVTYQGLVIPDPDRFGYGIGEGYFLLTGIPTATAPILSGWVGLGAKP